MKKTVYNIKTGEPVIVPGIDAREYIASGGWVEKWPEPADPEPVEAETELAEVPEPVEKKKTKKG